MQTMVRKRSSSRNRGESVVALVYPKSETDREITKDMVKKNINPVELHAGIKRVKKISKGGVLMELDSQKDFEKLEIEINSNEN